MNKWQIALIQEEIKSLWDNIFDYSILQNEILYRKMLVNDMLDWNITREFYNKCIDKLNKKYENS